ncbi:MAG: exodeoxyribonuclease VII large subunit, partial [Opitutales bacterium]
AGLQERRHQLATARAALAQRSPETRVQHESQRLLALWKRLQSASPASVLHRGYALVRDEQGRPVARKAGVRSGQRLQTEFGDGILPVRVE